MDKPKQVVQRLLKLADTTYAAEAGIKMNNKPMPLFQLLVLCMLASKPIDAAIAMSAARELFKAGLRTPKAVLAADRQTMIDAFGRAHYVRYDESSATRLTDMAERVRDEYSGDLREIAERSGHDVAARETYAQAIQRNWRHRCGHLPTRSAGCVDLGAPVLRRPRHRRGKAIGFAHCTGKAGALAPRSNARLAAALVRISLDDDVRRQVTG